MGKTELGQAIHKPLIVLGVVILIAIVIHHVVLVGRCCPATTKPAEPTPADSGQQPPYIAELRLLNPSDKSVKLEEVKVNLDPMNKGSEDPTEEGWEPIHDDFSPPLSEWLDPGLVRFALNAGPTGKVYGVYVKAVFDGGGTHERVVANLLGLKDTHVMVAAQIVKVEYQPPTGPPVVIDEEHVLLCAAEGISAVGLAAGKWDDD